MLEYGIVSQSPNTSSFHFQFKNDEPYAVYLSTVSIYIVLAILRPYTTRSPYASVVMLEFYFVTMGATGLTPIDVLAAVYVELNMLKGIII